MAQNNTLGMNRTFPIYNADDTAFHDLELKKSTVESVVMSLGDKVTGDVFYKDNTLAVTMQEYIIVDDVKYMLVSPPTIVREGMVSDNTQLKGMTKYSFTFYHPMYMLGNFPFTDIAVTQDEEKYLSQNKTFSWIGSLSDFVDKLNANLASTEWLVSISSSVTQDKRNEIPDDVLSFDKQFISDALKAGYDTWKIPFVITPTAQVVNGVTKKFKIEFGLPSQEIYTIDAQGQRTSTPFIFQFGKGVGLKNNSRTPRNNKIVTRIVGCGSERNVPFGYPQIVWTGNQQWDYTINNASGMQSITVGGVTIQAMSYPIYDGIVGGQKVRLIKHPFTRSTLMPSVYSDTVNKKVNPNTTGYNPDIEIKDYYDAVDDGTHEYPNNINLLSPSVELHQFEDIYPRLINQTLVSVSPYDGDIELISKTVYNTRIQNFKNQSANYNEKNALQDAYDKLALVNSITHTGGSYTYEYKRLKTQTYQYGTWYHVKYTSGNINYEYYVWDGTQAPQIDIVWDDTMNDDGEYVQSYFKIKLPVLNFDLYASAAVTQEMKINMRSGDCLGCTFPVQVDWDDYKANFYDADGNFDPVIGSGHPRNGDKYPDSSQGQITIVVQKDNETFGTLMPNIYQQPASGDKFVILGISLPTSYITDAEEELDEAMKEYMLENNVHYYDYPLKFDEYFLATNTGILEQIQNNNIVRFQYGDELPKALYIQQITIKYGEKPLPQYDITLTDDIEIVLNQIGQVTDDVSRMRVQVSELQKYYSENLIQEINSKLSKVVDDVCQGRITFQQGLDAIGSVIFHDEVRSPQFESGLYTGRGWRIDNLGNAEFESIHIRSYLEVVELLVNRLQAQEGDTLFTDNDQIDRVDRIVDETDGSVSYVLSLKEKYQGYITGQMYGNVVKGIINTLAAKQAGVSDVQDSQTVEIDGSNTYYTSWMQVIATHNTNNPDNSLGVNQIKVVLYGDDYYDEGHEGEPDHLHHITPAGKNFEPCELMTIARWGCVDYSDPEDQDYESIKASIIRRQRMFMISTTEGRVVKYTGVDSPILRNGNYGVTIGELPEFVKNYSDVRAILNQVGEHTDWLYAQGVVVGKFIKVDIEGNPEPNIIDCGNWVNGANVVSPTPRNGVYLYNEWNSQTQQYETHDVWHNNAKWRCKMSQPVVSGGVAHYYEPTDANSAYWQKLASGGQDGEDSTGYKLLPNPNIIKTKQTGENTYNPATASLTCGYVKNVGGTITSVANATSVIDNRYAIYFRRKSRGGDYESKYWFYADRKARAFLSSLSLSGYDAVEFYLAKNSLTPSFDIVTRATFLNSLSGVIDNIIVLVVSDGTSPFIADLDNEMDGVACDVDGDSYHSQTCTTTASLLQGTTKKSFTLKIREWDEDGQEYNEITQSGSILTDVVISWTNNSDNSKTITFAFSKGVTINDKREFIVVMIADNMEYKAVFTVNGVLPGANGKPATLYNIIPSPNDIAFSRLASGGLTPDNQYLTFTVKKTVGNETTIIYTAQLEQNNLIARYSTSDPPASKTSGVAWGTGSGSGTTQITFNNIGNAVISKNVTFQQIYIALFGSDGTLHDRETIPVIKDGNNGQDGQDGKDGKDGQDGQDGKDGQDALNLVLDTYSIAFPTDSDYYVENELRYTVGAKMFLGNNTQQTITTNINAISDDGDVYVNGTTNSINITIGEARFKNKITISVTATCSLGTRTAEIYLTAVPMGAVGNRGKTGRFYYYAGEFDVSDSTHTFIVNDAQAPYFKTGQLTYHVYNAETNGSYTMAQMGSNFNSAPWEIMTNDFKYLITEAIFGSYAHFGSFIINGDWLLSTNGKVGESVVSGESNISGSIVGGSSFSVKAVTLFDSAYPSDGMVDIAYENNTVTIATSETTKQIMTVYLSASLTYRVSCDYSRSSGGSFYVRIRHASYGSVTPIYLPNTSGSASGNFRVTTSGTYIVEIYATSTGYTASVWNTSVSRLLFAPMYAVDGKTGASYQGGNGVFRGFVRKQKTRITTSNINQYKRTDITSATVLDFDKCGSFIELATGTYDYITLPFMSDYLASRYTSKQIDDIRSFVGTTMLIYNKSGQNIPMTLRYNSDGSTTSGTLHNGNCVELECCLDADANDGKEIIYWKVISYAEPVV